METPTAPQSTRQYEIVFSLAEGKDIKTIARQMGISTSTVKHQSTIAFRKINAESRTLDTLWAIQGIVDSRTVS